MIFKELKAYSSEEQPKENTKTVHFETKIDKQEDAHVEEELDVSEDGEEEGLESLDDLRDEHTEEDE